MSVHFTHQLEHLDLIASAPEGVKRLRELILELAVRGKLVPQDPNDEPASELLKRIQAEKAKLVTEGRIKKDKPLAEIGVEEKPFELAVGWEWSRIGHLGRDWGQKTPDIPFTYIDVSAIENKRGVIVDPTQVQPAEAPSRARKRVEEGTVIYSTVRPYLLNIAVIDRQFDPEPIASTAFAIVHPLGGIASQYLFWYLRSPTFVSYVASVQTGIAYPAINDGQFYAGLVPLPPLPEQHRIVAKVDELMALCDRLEAQQTDAASAHTTLVKTLLDTLTLPNHLLSHASAQRPDRSGRPVRSATGPGSGHDQTPISPSQSANDFTANWRRLAQHFDTLISTEASVTALKQTLLKLAVMGKLVPQDPNDEPASDLLKRIQIEKARLEEEGKIKKNKPLPEIGDDEKPYELPEGWEWVRIDSYCEVQGGIQKTPLRRPVKQHYPYLRVANVQRGYIDTARLERFELACDELEKWQLEAGDLLVVEGNGSDEEVGRCAVWAGQVEDCVYQNHLIRVRSRNREAAIFLQLFLNAPVGMAEMKRLAITTSGLFNLSVGKIRNIPVALPPLPEQHRIVAKVDELMALCDHLASRLKAARELSAKYATVVTETALESAAGHAAIA